VKKLEKDKKLQSDTCKAPAVANIPWNMRVVFFSTSDGL